MTAETTVIQNAIRGSPKAWQMLLSQHYSSIFSLVASRVQNRADVQDITQETFIQCYLKLSQLKDPGKFKSWLRQIALNLCRDWYRRQSKDWVPLTDDPDTGVINIGQTLLRPLPKVLINLSCHYVTNRPVRFTKELLLAKNLGCRPRFWLKFIAKT